MTSSGIYHNGSSATAFPCQLVLENESLLIYLENQDNQLLIWNIKSLKTCQLNGNHLMATYGFYPHQSIECTGEISKLIFDVYTGKNVIAKAQSFNYSKPVLAILILSVILILTVVLSYFYLLPFIGEKSVQLIPKETEIELGNSVADKILMGSNENDSATFYMKQFTAKLNFNSPYKMNVRVIDSKEINAFALPGGNIFVYSSILKKMNGADELVALLGHEQTHVNKRHSLKSICRSAAASILIATVFGDISGISAGILYQAQEFEQLNYSRDLETEADDEGLQFMIQNKSNPLGMVALLELLKKENAETPSMMKYLSTHPETESRILNVKSQITNVNDFTANKEMDSLFAKIKSKL